MKKKFLMFILCICFIIPAIFCLSACVQPDEPPNEPVTITIKYYTDSGNLSFTSKEVELTNGKYLMSEDDLPTISNEGNDKIFDYWETVDGVPFDFELELTEDVELYAIFCESEWVWEETWKRYNSMATFCSDYTQKVSLNENGGLTNLSTTLGSKPYNPSFKKIKKSECMNKYITQEEYQALPISLCFITDNRTSKRIVTEDDFTLDTYCCYEFLFIKDVYYGQCSNLKYLPKGMDVSSWSGVLDPAWQYSIKVVQEKFGAGVQNVEYAISQSGQNVLYLSVDEIEEITSEIFDSMLNDSNYNYSANKNWQDDVYYTFVSYNWVKFKCTLENGDIKYFILEESAPGYHSLLEDVSKAEYDSRI